MPCLSPCNHPFLTLMKDPIPKGDHPFIDSLQPCSHNNDFIVSGRIPITAMNIGHDKLIPQCLQISIAESPFSTEFRAPHFKPNEIIRIISDPHLVRFGIPESTNHIHDISPAKPLNE